uniref:Sugar phosphate transporter domain-containing protein n=1 Tax=Latimeria chalumnae TaxID=7897 RepID=M3XGT3_LATCH|nr:PREDICTED: solute carrier family 35 member D3-like [Latimeria chalumnae]|eukprot:XP_014350351.1 PREDICTED: solute carrier family 35 member D3-like [Latimeria chalumnae]
MVISALSKGFSSIWCLPGSHYCSFLPNLVLYILCSEYSDFLNRVFITQYRYGYPAFLTLCQVLLTWFILEWLRFFQWTSIQPYSLEVGEILLLPSICFSFHSILSLWAVTNAPFTSYMLIIRFMPLVNLILAHLFTIKSKPSLRETFIVIIVTLCSIITGVQNFHDDAITYVYGLLGLAFESFYLTLIQKTKEDQRLSAVNIHYTCVINSVPILVVLCLIHPDTLKALASGSWLSLIFLGFFSLLLILGCILKFLICFCACQSSAVTVGMMDIAKRDTMTLRSLLPYKQSSLSLPFLTSLFISLSGIGIYAYGHYIDILPVPSVLNGHFI